MWNAHLTDALPEGLKHDTVELDAITLELLRTPRQLAKVAARGRRARTGGQSQRAHPRAVDVRSHDGGAGAAISGSRECDPGPRAAASHCERSAATAAGMDRAGREFRRRRVRCGGRTRGREARGGRGTRAERQPTLRRRWLTAKEIARAIETRIRDEVRDPARVERTALTNLRSELARLDHRAYPKRQRTPCPIAGLADWASAVIDAGSRELKRLRELSRSENEAANNKDRRRPGDRDCNGLR